jgi:hypothetical protein
MTSTLRASEEEVKFHTTEAYGNLGLNRSKVRYSVRRLCSDEKEKLTVVVVVVALVVVVVQQQQQQQ